MEFVPLTVVAIKFIHPHLQHVNVRKVISLIVVHVSQSVTLTQFGNQANVSVLPNILALTFAGKVTQDSELPNTSLGGGLKSLSKGAALMTQVLRPFDSTSD